MNELVKTNGLEKEISPIISQADRIVISNPVQYEGAADFLKDLKSAQKKVTDFFAPLKKKAHETWKAITTKEGEVLNPLQNSEAMIKNKMIVFQKVEEEKRIAEQRRLQAEAEEQARKERERLQKQAEKLKTPELKEQRLQEAEEVEVAVITVQSEVPEVKGISYRKIWKAEITDKPEFVRAALKNATLMSFIHIDATQMNKLATMTKGEISYPGIRFYEEKILASGGK
jgi:hypothetical protein